MTIGKGVTNIEYGAFIGCEALSSVTIPNSVTTIGSHAFAWDSSLWCVRIPDSVASIGTNAFVETALSTVHVSVGDTARVRAMLEMAGNDVGGIYFEESLPSTFYKVRFAGNGGTGSMAVQKIRVDASTAIHPNTFTRTGYTFLGWATTADGAVVYPDKARVKNLAASGESITLYAKWKGKPYKVAFNANGGKGKMPVQSMTYGKVSRLRKNAFMRSGFVFMGWAKTKTGNAVYKNQQAVKNLRADGKTTILYAKWAKKTYKVSFNANGGQGTMSSQTMTYGKVERLRKNAFSRPGYTIKGWAKTRTGKVMYADQQAVKNLRADGKTTTLYAKWAKTKYKVAFNANGGKGKMAAQVMTYGKAAKLKSNSFKRTGYAFAGWAKTKTGKVVYKNAAVVKNLKADGKTLTLYAKWTLTTYRIVFDANGGRGTMADQIVKYGATTNLHPNAFTRDGYAFLAWATTATGDAEYVDGQAIKNLLANGGTLSLYALWYKGRSVSPRSSLQRVVEAAQLAEREGDGRLEGLASGSAIAKTMADRDEEVGREVRGSIPDVETTTSDGSEGYAMVDGDEGTAWTTDATEGSWVILTFAGALEVEDVEVLGKNLPEGIRFLLSEDAFDWQEGVPGRAQHVWVVFPSGEEPFAVNEIRVLEE